MYVEIQHNKVSDCCDATVDLGGRCMACKEMCDAIDDVCNCSRDGGVFCPKSTVRCKKCGLPIN